MGVSVMAGAYMVGVDRSFLDTTTWIVVSAFGVIGNHYQMMMIFNDKKKSTFFQSMILWTVVFSGYMIPCFVTRQSGGVVDMEWLALWDNVMRQSGAFRVWMINVGIAVMWCEAAWTTKSSVSAVHGTKKIAVAATTSEEPNIY
jgi:hypothetical protein